MVKKIFLDTNVWLRFLLKDQQQQFIWSEKLISAVEEGKFLPYVSAIVLLEIHYVLSKLYSIQKNKVDNIIRGILTTRNLVIVKKIDFKKAFDLSLNQNIKLSDCLIVANLPVNCQLITWDKQLKKIKNIKIKTPEEILSS